MEEKKNRLLGKKRLEDGPRDSVLRSPAEKHTNQKKTLRGGGGRVFGSREKGAKKKLERSEESSRVNRK